MQTGTTEKQIKEKERVKIRKAGKSKGPLDYLTELMKSKLQRFIPGDWENIEKIFYLLNA